jgi:hypothetical protein
MNVIMETLIVILVKQLASRVESSAKNKFIYCGAIAGRCAPEESKKEKGRRR